jgi:hypothetical protein
MDFYQTVAAMSKIKKLQARGACPLISAWGGNVGNHRCKAAREALHETLLGRRPATLATLGFPRLKQPSICAVHCIVGGCSSSFRLPPTHIALRGGLPSYEAL